MKEDQLVCGACQQNFPLSDILMFLLHKNTFCGPGSCLGCQSCMQRFMSPWELLQHAQQEHRMKIYTSPSHPNTATGENEGSSTPKGRLEESEPQSEAPSSILADEQRDVSAENSDQNQCISTEVSPSTETLSSGALAEKESSKTLSSNVQEVSKDLPRHSLSEKGTCTRDGTVSTHVTSKPKNITGIGSGVESVTPRTRSGQKSRSGHGTHDAAVQTCQDPLGVRACEKRARRSSSQREETGTGRLCCDRAECGVTVMPGTHENLKKCCSVVIPKKRKRHMETKHLQAFKLKKRALERVTKEARSPSVASSIYIDIETPNQQAVSSATPASVQVRGQRSQANLDEELNVASILSSMTARSSSTTQQGTTIPECCRQRIEEEGREKSNTPQSTGSGGGTLLTNSNLQVLGSFVPLVARSTASLPLISTFLTAPIATGNHDNQQAGVSTLSTANVTAATSCPDANCSFGRGPESTSQCQPCPTQMSALDKSQLGSKKRRYPTSKPYKCDKCDHAFNQKVHLRKHESKHTGIKPYKCDQCDYATVERSHLKVHIRVHTGEKPYKCKYCEYATAQNSTLKIHQKRHHSLSRTLKPSTPPSSN